MIAYNPPYVNFSFFPINIKKFSEDDSPIEFLASECSSNKCAPAKQTFFNAKHTFFRLDGPFNFLRRLFGLVETDAVVANAADHIGAGLRDKLNTDTNDFEATYAGGNLVLTPGPTGTPGNSFVIT